MMVVLINGVAVKSVAWFDTVAFDVARGAIVVNVAVGASLSRLNNRSTGGNGVDMSGARTNGIAMSLVPVVPGMCVVACVVGRL